MLRRRRRGVRGVRARRRGRGWGSGAGDPLPRHFLGTGVGEWGESKPALYDDGPAGTRLSDEASRRAGLGLEWHEGKWQKRKMSQWQNGKMAKWEMAEEKVTKRFAFHSVV